MGLAALCTPGTVREILIYSVRTPTLDGFYEVDGIERHAPGDASVAGVIVRSLWVGTTASSPKPCTSEAALR